jgi:hypothetical protein
MARFMPRFARYEPSREEIHVHPGDAEDEAADGAA